MTVALPHDLLLILLFATFTAGAFFGQLCHRREATRSSICPTCYGPTDDEGTSEGWGADR